jgi:hypothetical protein
MTDKPKVTAHLDKPVTTIDGETGDVSVTRKGVMKGFGKGLEEFIQKGMKVSVGAEIFVGQFPDGHKDAGHWAVQIMISPFPSQIVANATADRVLPIIEGLLGIKGITQQ